MQVVECSLSVSQVIFYFTLSCIHFSHLEIAELVYVLSYTHPHLSQGEQVCAPICSHSHTGNPEARFSGLDHSTCLHHLPLSACFPTSPRGLQAGSSSIMAQLAFVWTRFTPWSPLFVGYGRHTILSWLGYWTLS